MKQKTINRETIKTAPSPTQIGIYAIERLIGHGGMGEVYLARDPICDRELALKRIRPHLAKDPSIQKRFLKEAHVASQLSHPSIIPILSIQTSPPDIYYTMPYVAGDTLRNILRAATEGHALSSIPALVRIFLQICEAIAYTHSKKIVHRDLKPENILIGKYGEVMILDWGIADFFSLNPEQLTTPPNKVAGTLAYMAPERLVQTACSVPIDIYALGAMFYHMLTLQVPFQRKNLAAFRKQAPFEQLINPIELAPYRDIPYQLASICFKCLAFAPENRFQSTEELIAELKSYIEGKAQWIPAASLDPHRSTDWQFQENILLHKYIGITGNLDKSDWAVLMVSEQGFATHLKIEGRLRLREKTEGVGFLLCMPSPEERHALEEGYCIWLTSTACHLYRNSLRVFSAPHGKTWQQPVHFHIEKVEDTLRIFLDDQLICTHSSHSPLAGAHVGLLYRDQGFELLDAITISDASHNAYVRCLAVPNAFLSHKLYDLALQEYRKIGQSFPGHQEGREALFRAGIALLEKGKAQRTKSLREQLYYRALKEFGKLYRTSGAPLEYLGKSLVYKELGDAEEEAKCLELALRKFVRHPLLAILKEHVVYRMHESSQTERDSAYRIILLAIRHIPELLENVDTRSLLESLQHNLEPLFFLEPSADSLSHIAIQLAFWLAKPPILGEIVMQLAARPTLSTDLIENGLFCLLELDAIAELKHQLETLPAAAIEEKSRSYFDAILTNQIPTFPEKGSRKEARVLSYLLRRAMTKRQQDSLEKLAKLVTSCKWRPEDQSSLMSLLIWRHFFRQEWSSAGKILHKYSSQLTQENSPFHFAYGCWLHGTNRTEDAQAHFAQVLDTPYPSIAALPSHFLAGRISSKRSWAEHAFWWEKKELRRQLEFFYRAIGKKQK